MKSFLVIGLGRFGRHLTTKLIELGNEVMVVDRDEERVARLEGIATASCVGDCQDEQVLAALGVRNYDVCFVCVSDDFQCSLEVTAMPEGSWAPNTWWPGQTGRSRPSSSRRSARTSSSTRKWIWPSGRPCAFPPATPSTILS
jgi:threonine dehydrogenase-like Zn-dependent dehydrogenase